MMKWQSVKNRVIKHAYEQYEKEIIHDPAKIQLLLMRLRLNDELAVLQKQTVKSGIGDQLKMELWQKITSLIESWDIKQWKALRDLYPLAFPKGILETEITDDGWLLK